jgi:electron transport complex protein RnfC
MLKKSFFGLTQPWLRYEKFLEPPKRIRQIPPPDTVTYFFNSSLEKTTDLKLNIGDLIKRGEPIILKDEPGGTQVGTSTGKVTAIAPYSGDLGRRYTAVTVKVTDKQMRDNGFTAYTESPEIESMRSYLAGAPGHPPLDRLVDPDKPIDTIVVDAMDNDILIGTRQYVLQTDFATVIKGIETLRRATDIDRIVMVVPRESFQGYGHIGAEVLAADFKYPAGNPYLIVSNLLKKEIPSGQSFEDIGVCFFSIEAVASLGRAYTEGSVPDNKIITFIDKKGAQSLAAVRVGTPVADVLSAYGVTLNDRDRLIFGGPMTGWAVYDVEHPILADTDAVFVQDRESIPYSSDYPCINCGDCIRACPVNIPIDMLVRFLEAGLFQEAADQYALEACIECGLCSYVCVSKIPIFQYIRLGKYELSRERLAEAAND